MTENYVIFIAVLYPLKRKFARSQHLYALIVPSNTFLRNLISFLFLVSSCSSKVSFKRRLYIRQIRGCVHVYWRRWLKTKIMFLGIIHSAVLISKHNVPGTRFSLCLQVFIRGRNCSDTASHWHRVCFYFVVGDNRSPWCSWIPDINCFLVLVNGNVVYLDSVGCGLPVYMHIFLFVWMCVWFCDVCL